jgi:hypothetical protein
MCEFRRLFSIGGGAGPLERIITDGSFDRQSMHHLMDHLNSLLRTLDEHGVTCMDAMEVRPERNGRLLAHDRQA